MLAFVLLVIARPANAEPTHVALVRPAAADALLAEATTRVRAELTAAGFEVVELDAEEGVDPRVQVESARLDPLPVATLALLRIGQGPAAEIWIADRLTKKTVVRRIDVGDGGRRSPSVLAVRAVELLRASLLEAAVPSRERANERSSEGASGDEADRERVPDDVTHFIAPTLRSAAAAASARTGAKSATSTGTSASSTTTESSGSAQPVFSAGLGAALLFGFRGLSPAYAPVLRLGYGGPTLAGRVTVVAPAFGAGASAPDGNTTVRQELSLVEAVGSWPRRERWAFVASAGAGAYHWHVNGTATSPNLGHTADRWGALFGAGIGAVLRLGERSGISLDGQALLFAPNLAVAIGNADVGGTGRPTLLATIGLWEAFP